MIFVVFQHILTFALPDIPESWIASFIKTFRMPLFFFISGFVSYKAVFEWNLINFGKIQLKKIRGQLLPTFVMFFLFVTLHDQQYEKWIFDWAHAGYWFTIVSFEIFLTYCIISMFCRKIKNQNILLLIFVLSAIGISCVWQNIGHFCRTKTMQLFSVGCYVKYYIYFIAGIIVRCKMDTFHKLIENKYVTLLLFVLAIILPYIFPKYNMTIIILSRLCCIYSVFYFFREFFETNNKFSLGLSTIGRHTLEIYFLHYFLLFRMPHIQSIFNSLLNDKCFYGPSAEWFVELVIVCVVSVFLCFACIGIKKIISAFPIISELCFGPQKK